MIYPPDSPQYRDFLCTPLREEWRQYDDAASHVASYHA